MSDDLSIPNPGYRGNRAGRYGTGQTRMRPGMGPDTRRLVLFAGGLGAVLVVLIAASTLIGHRSNEIPVVVADNRPIRVKPENPGGMKIDGAENDVFSGGSDIANARLAPLAEKPDARALVAPEEAPPPPPVVANPTATPPPVVATPAPEPPTVPSIKPSVVAAVPAAKPVSRPDAAVAAPRPTNSVAAAPAEAPPAPVAVEAHPSTPGRRAMVQLAALSSEEAARNEWQQLSKRMPGLLDGKQPVFSRTEKGGRMFWRLRTAGFADAEQARTFCEHVRAKGGGCSVADF